VILNPPEGKSLIKRAGVGYTFADKKWPARKPNAPSCIRVNRLSEVRLRSTYSILNADTDEPFPIRVDQARHIVCAVSLTVPATVNVEKDKQTRCILLCIHMEKQAVFANRRQRLKAARTFFASLWASTTNGDCIIDCIMVGSGWPRCLPTN
jgi:hypothetical protein